MGNMEILRRNRVDTAQSITSNQTVLLPLANLQDASPSVRTRLNGKTNVQVIIQLSNEPTWNIRTVAILGTNLTPSGTITVQHGTDGSTWDAGEVISLGVSTLGFDEGGFGEGGYGGYPTPEEQKNAKGLMHFHRYGSAVDEDWWLLTFEDSENDADYLEIGRINVCDPFVPEYNWQVLNYEPIDTGNRDISDAGVLYSDVVDVRRGVSFGFEAISEAELFGQWAWMHQQLGGGIPTEIIFTPDATSGAKEWLAMHGFFRDQPSYGWWGASDGRQMFSGSGLFFEEVY